MSWQLLDTAPEHTSIIVCAPWPDGQPFVGEGYRDWDGTWLWADHTPIEPRNKPTHWMPFPAAPAIKNTGE